MSNEIKSIREKITNKIILITVVFWAPGYLASIARWLEFGWKDIYIIHTVMYVMILTLYYFRKKLSTELKLYILTASFTILGLAALWYLGFSGVHYFVIIAIAIATILTERRMAFLLIIFTCISYITIAILIMVHVVEPKFDLNVLSHSIIQWSSVIFSLLTFSIIFIEGFGQLYNRLLFSIDDKGKIAKALEHQNEVLLKTQGQLNQKFEELNKLNVRLQVSEEKYRNMVNVFPDVLYRYSTKNGGLFFSESIKNILGYEPSELEHSVEKWQQILLPEDWNTLHEQLKKSVVNERNVLENRLLTKTGEWIWVNNAFVVLKKNQDEILVEGHFSDITEKKRMELLLKDSELRWQFAVDGSNLGLWDWEIPSGKVFFSKRWKSMLGHEDHEIAGDFIEWENRVHPDDLPETKRKLEECFANKEVDYLSEFRMRCKDGSYKWILDRGKVLSYDEDGKPLRMIGTHADITEQKLAEFDLKRINSTKDKLFSIIAHDLKSPFNSMIGLSEILKNNFDELDVNSKKKFVNAVHGGILETYDLLEDLLLWAFTQRDTIAFNSEPLDLQVLITQVKGTLKLAADAKTISILSQIPAGTIVNADRFMLAAILRNLISNAIKFTPKGGEIIISLDTLSKENKRFTKIGVHDNGVGVSPENQATIFDVDGNTSTKGTENEKGTGMGLSICYEFVKKHGGTIWLESEPGKGSNFYFTLPDSTVS
ncbi:sensor histidine kinase [Maribellus sediminis]|uniref:sensor histidine kinase n=1 Tax=Maribellus sediminis TaxID=2696285 RepID=UPI0014315597|nr:PAS domain-containing sensor histidine kinase [Maribellus sediminis]